MRGHFLQKHLGRKAVPGINHVLSELIHEENGFGVRHENCLGLLVPDVAPVIAEISGGGRNLLAPAIAGTGVIRVRESAIAGLRACNIRLLELALANIRLI